MSRRSTFRDTFAEDRRRGRVVGSRTPEGILRGGIDVERVLSIDHGALRIQPLLQAGWNRACLSYGPFDRRAGLVLAVSMVNGHNTSQAEQLPDTLRARLHRWLVGSESSRIRRRVWRWAVTGRVRRSLRQFRWWARTAKGRTSVEPLDENLAVGWFPSKGSYPMEQGSAFVMHATGPENGELWGRMGGGLVPVIRGVQNLHIYYVVALRAGSAAYYAASVPGAHGLAPYPSLRPLGIDTGVEGGKVWASIHQSVLGQIGFRLDTRVHGVGIAQLAEWEPWHGGAHAADRFEGEGPLDGSRDTLGCLWTGVDGTLHRTSRGAVANDGHGGAMLKPPAVSGLIRCVFAHGGGTDGAAALWWRMRDASNRWELRLLGERAELAIIVDGKREILASEYRAMLQDCDAQVVDDGRNLSIALNGSLLFGSLLADTRLGEETKLGIALQGSADRGPRSTLFEAHPRAIQLPEALDLGPPWFRQGERILVSDTFSGAPGPLQGTRTSFGDKRWERIHGVGVFERTGGGAARVQADREHPSPGRTMYAVEWDRPEFADVEVTITPPGTGRGQRENGIAGFVIWQDDDNYITVNTWVCDAYAGASISCFFNIRGWEDIYDAIWSNVGPRVQHGKPFRLRLTCDGLRYMVFVDDEPVVQRSLTDVYRDCRPMQIRRVGLIANWEWGRDTGSVFRDFRARA